MRILITCKICGKKVKLLRKHLKAHNISPEDYVNTYGETEFVSEEFKEMMNKRNKSEKMRSITVERNKSQEMREVISKRNQDLSFINKCKEGISKSEKFHKSASERMSKYNKELWGDDRRRDILIKKIKVNQKEYMNTEESKSRQREVMIRNWQNKEISERMLNAVKSSKYGVHKEWKNDKFGIVNCKSMGEYEFLEAIVKLHGLSSIEYESIRIKMDDGRTYIPDFLVIIEGYKYLVEVKFCEWMDEYPEKSYSAIKYCKENGINFCWVRRFIEIPQILKDMSLENCTVYSPCKIR